VRAFGGFPWCERLHHLPEVSVQMMTPVLFYTLALPNTVVQLVGRKSQRHGWSVLAQQQTHVPRGSS